MIPLKRSLEHLRSTSLLCLLSALLGLADAHSVLAAETSPEVRIRDVPLIAEGRYDPNESNRAWRKVRSSGSTIVAATVGTLAWNVVDLKEIIKSKISENKQVAGYFTEQERDRLAERILKKIESKVSGVITNSDATLVVRTIGADLVSAVVDRSMEKEGVASQTARSAWVKKIVDQFDVCGRKAKTYFEAQGCVDVTVASLPKNLGLALTHELTRQELTPSVKKSKDVAVLELSLDQRYRQCVNRGGSSGNPDIKECVLQAMRAGVLNVTDVALRDKLSEHFKGPNLEKIRAGAWPAFAGCLKAASDSAGFMRCIDGLIIGATAATVEQKVFENPSVSAMVPDAARRKKLAAEKRVIFEKCAEEEKARNVRKDGLLTTDRCQDLVDSQVTQTVILRAFHDSVVSNLGADDPEFQKVLTAGTSALNGCWQKAKSVDQKNSCVRSAVIVLADCASARRIDRDVPRELREMNVMFKTRLMEDYHRCLTTGLPTDVVNSPERDTTLNNCSGELRRKAAIPSADFKIRQALGTRLKPDELDALVKAQVAGFVRCLGSTPTSQMLISCSMTLTREAAKAGGAVVVPSELKSYLADLDPPSTPQEKAQASRFTQQETKRLNACLDEKLVAGHELEADALTENCFKDTIHGTAMYLAGFQFDRETTKLYKETQEAQRTQLRAKFLQQLHACIEPSPAARASTSLDAYTSKVYDCAEISATDVTKAVVTQQVGFAVEDYLPDLDGVSFAAQRNSVQRAIQSKFESCMRDLPSGKADGARTKCTESLQRDATQAIGVAVGRAQAAVQLPGTPPLPKIIKTENEFRSCVASSGAGAQLSKDLEACLKSFTIGLATGLGDEKVRKTLLEILGSKEFAATQGATEKSLQKFHGCLERARPLPMGKVFLDGIQSCAAELQDSARGQVAVQLREWLRTSQSGKSGQSGQAPGDSARELLAGAIPCMENLMADRGTGNSPEGAIAAAGVDAEGILEAMAGVLRDYIDYDGKKADIDVPVALSNLQKDLATIAPAEARARLIRLMVERGAMDQLIKGVVRTSVSKALEGLPADQRFSAEVRARLLEKDTFDEIFGTPEGQKAIEKALTDVVWPVLGDGKSTRDPVVAKAQASLTKDVGRLLADSPRFGDVIIATSVQNGIKDMAFLTRFFAKVLYGSESLNWEKVRLTAKGRAAEAYIRDAIVRPKMTGEEFAQEEEQRRLEQAKELVTQAVKSYRS